MLAVFSALEAEIKDLKKHAGIYHTTQYGECRIHEGICGEKTVLLVVTGMGREKAERAADRVLGSYPVSRVVSTGFGGALNERSRAGDIIVYTDVRCGEREGRADFPRLECSAGMVRQAVELADVRGLLVMKGRGVTVEEVCSTPADKQRVGLGFSADVVDMESYWIGRKALEKGLPFLSARSIFDSVGDDLSFLEEITAGGRIDISEVLKCLFMRGQVQEMFGVYRKYRLAAAGLSVFLKNMLRHL
ncbi:MAG: hypothetical protein JXA46_05900 [Dehalococcoidales bacterium]|nr:hypothetical protein [Dehalococcoidales bacterium]